MAHTAPDGAAGKDGTPRSPSPPTARRSTSQDPDPVATGGDLQTAACPHHDLDVAAGLDRAGRAGGDVAAWLDPRAHWINRWGGPATLWRLYVDSGVDAERIADHFEQLAPSRGVYVDAKPVDEYGGRADLADVPGLVCVLSSEAPGSRRLPKTAQMLTIARDFRALRPTTAADGFRGGPDVWHRVGLLVACYTDYNLDDPHGRDLIDLACLCCPYTPGLPLTTDPFMVLQPGKAQQLKQRDQIAATSALLWRYVNRWGVTTLEQARQLRPAIDHEVDILETPTKRAMYRPLPDVEHNQLWLVLHDLDARPAADPILTEEESRAAADKFVGTGARAVRDAVAHLEAQFPWFSEPESIKRKHAQRHFNRLYHALWALTNNS